MAQPNYRGRISFLVPGAGATISGSPIVGAVAKGGTTFALSATTLTGTINAGDTITVSGQVYAVTAAVTASGNAATVVVTPGAVAAIAASTAFSAYTVTTYAPDLPVTGAPNSLCILAQLPSAASVQGSVVQSPQGVGILGVSASIESLGAAGSTVELWALKAGADPTLSASYVLWLANWLSAAGAGLTQAFASYPGLLIRCKTAGTPASGTTIVNFSAD